MCIFHIDSTRWTSERDVTAFGCMDNLFVDRQFICGNQHNLCTAVSHMKFTRLNLSHLCWLRKTDLTRRIGTTLWIRPNLIRSTSFHPLVMTNKYIRLEKRRSNRYFTESLRPIDFLESKGGEIGAILSIYCDDNGYPHLYQTFESFDGIWAFRIQAKISIVGGNQNRSIHKLAIHVGHIIGSPLIMQITWR